MKSLGGRVTHELGIVGGFSALVPGSAVPELSASPLVWRVWGDAPVHMQGVSMGQYDYAAANTVWKQVINLPKTNNQYTGAGVTVALVDTGVVPVPDLASRIVHALDLTGEADGLDRYGHGTHMAGIIAGTGAASGGTYSGVAPGANLVSIKVAGLDGSTDASVVMAGLQWAVTHRAQYNIKVLNLSFGTDGTQSYSIDPLDYAVEQAWRAGIFVVVSAGNRGSAPGTINKPGDDPFVMTVGAADLDNTTNSSDDTVAPFSSEGPTQDSLAKPDVVAPVEEICRQPITKLMLQGEQGMISVLEESLRRLGDFLNRRARIGERFHQGAAAINTDEIDVIFRAVNGWRCPCLRRYALRRLYLKMMIFLPRPCARTSASTFTPATRG